MPIDPQLAPILAAANAAADQLPPIWDQSVEERRAAYLALAHQAGPGPELHRVEDIDIAGVPCRLYAPREPEGVIVYLHGGGFTIGDLDTHDEPCRQVAVAAGATLIAVDYRLAPEHPYPRGLEDAWNVLREIDARRHTFGANGQLVLVGDSAGGNLAAVLAIMARDSGIELAAQILIYPTVDLLDASPSMVDNASGYVLTQDTLDWFLDKYQADPTDWRASPLRADSLEGVAPALVLTAEYDMMRDQGIAYAEALSAAGVEATHLNYEGLIHAFFHLGPLVDAARDAVQRVGTAARAALRGT